MRRSTPNESEVVPLPISSNPTPAVRVALPSDRAPIVIAPGDLDDSRVRALLLGHLAVTRAVAPESCHALDADELRAPSIRFWAAWDADRLLGVGALKSLSPEHGEIKSMHTIPECRRQGVGSAMLRHIIGTARAMGMRRLSLETGSWDDFVPARQLYEKHGFVVCEPFGEYVLDPNSVFMTRNL